MQPELFNAFPAPPAQPHSETSLAAARAVVPFAAAQRRRVYDFLRHVGDTGATDGEIQDALCLNGNGERPRRIELVRAGLVRDSGRTRKTPHQRAAVVWVAVEGER